MSVTNTYICEVMDVLTGWEESFHSGHVYQIISDILTILYVNYSSKKAGKNAYQRKKRKLQPIL